MHEANILLAMKQMLFYVMFAVSMISIPMLIVGVFFSVIQAATQINEVTITFIPKIIVMFLLLIFFSHWMMEKLVEFTHHLINNLPYYLR